MLGEENVGVWTNNNDIIRIQHILEKYGIYHAKEKIWKVWGDYSENCHKVSFLSTDGMADELIYAEYWCYLNDIISDFEEQWILHEVITNILKKF